jgi:hypothetical protein
MNWIRQHRPSPGTAFGFAALMVALGGVAFAAIPDSNGTIHGCFQKSNGDLRVVEASSNCRSSENPLNWNVQGGGRMAAGVGLSDNAREFLADPVSNPDPSPKISAQITTTSAGRLLITAPSGGVSWVCPSDGPTCHPSQGFYLDGQPIPGTGWDFGPDGLSPGSGAGTVLLGPLVWLTDSVPPGAHTITFQVKRDGASIEVFGGAEQVGGAFSVTGPYDGT